LNEKKKVFANPCLCIEGKFVNASKAQRNQSADDLKSKSQHHCNSCSPAEIKSTVLLLEPAIIPTSNICSFENFQVAFN
jgi:hypothetical protein